MTPFIATLLVILGAGPAFAQTQSDDDQVLPTNPTSAARCSDIGAADNVTAVEGTRRGCPDVKGTWRSSSGALKAREVTAKDLGGYGYVGDGASRPLSGVMNLNGRNTAGWTLQQWRAVLPGAQALTDNIDEAAIASAIQASVGDVILRLGPGTIVFTKPLILCDKAVIIQGDSLLSYNGVTKILVRHGGNGIEHCAGASQRSRLELRNIDLTLDTAYQSTTSAAWALYDRKANWTRLDNVRVVGFNNCLRLTDPQGTMLTRVQCYNPDNERKNTGIGFYYEGTASFENKIYDSGVLAFRQAYYLKSLVAGKPAGTIGLEDFTIRNSGCGHSQDCITVTSDDRRYGGLFFKFEGMSGEAIGQFIQMRGGTHVIVRDGLWLIYHKPATSTWIDNKSLFEFGGDVGVSGQADIGTTSIRVENNNIYVSDAAGATVESVFRLNSRTSDVVFANNQIGLPYLKVTKGFFYFSNYHHPDLDFQFWMRPNSVTEYGTRWRSPGARFVPPANAYYTETDPVGGFSIESTERTYTYYDMEIFKRGLASTSPALCGTGSSVSPGSSNNSGTVNDAGPRAGPATCTINFAQPYWNMVPRCIVQSSNGAIPVTVVSVTQSQLVYRRASGPITVTYRCE
ncbi:hypothetical protein [Labrys sp. WJW]|uniref:hypothetical protein n=1 Tax=Labrys sp. WJW TaxID=1737983 RepID=UPI0012EA70C8|nr:hypothetical protein [Labrys sp. WJW]